MSLTVVVAFVQVRDEFLFQGRQDVSQDVRDNWILLLTDKEIQLTVRWVAHQINKKFSGKRIVITGILKGVFVFMKDLCSHLTIPYVFLCCFVVLGLKTVVDCSLAASEVVVRSVPRVCACGEKNAVSPPLLPPDIRCTFSKPRATSARRRRKPLCSRPRSTRPSSREHKLCWWMSCLTTVGWLLLLVR